jgi:hypothetical protein
MQPPQQPLVRLWQLRPQPASSQAQGSWESSAHHEGGANPATFKAC